MAHYDTSEFRNGLKVEIDGVPYEMVYFQFVKPGKGTAFTRTKIKNMISGAVIERTYRTGETLMAADIEEVACQYLYEDGEFYHFMQPESFEQFAVEATKVEEVKDFLTPNLDVSVTFFKGKAISVNLPYFIESEVTYCEPGARGNTATGVLKPATLATGGTVQVPLFIEVGEIIRVDTRTGAYVSRVGKGGA